MANFNLNKTTKDNVRIGLIEELDALNAKLLSIDITQPILNPAGQKTQDIADLKVQYDNLVARKQIVEQMLVGIDASCSVMGQLQLAQVGDWGAIEAVKLHYTYNQSFTSEWGATSTESWARRMLATLLGIEGDPMATPSYSTVIGTNYRRYERKGFVKNINRRYYENSKYNGTRDVVAYSSNSYSYPSHGLSLRAWRNTSQVAKTITFTYNAGMYSTYGSANVFVFTPNKDNASRVLTTSLSFTNAYNNSGSGQTGFASVSVTIPANTTVLVLMQASDYMYYSSQGYQFDKLLMTKGEDAIDTAIIQDQDMMNIMLSTAGMGGKLYLTSLEQLWTLSPTYSNADLVANPTLMVSATDDADAATKGVAVGTVYNSLGVVKIRMV